MTRVWRARLRQALTGPVLALVGGLGACALALPEARRPALLAAGLGATAVVAALVTGWRPLATTALALVAAAPLLAGAIEPAAAHPSRLLLATALLLMLVAGLDGAERGDKGATVPVVRSLAPRWRRWGTPLLAVGTSVVVASVGGAPAVPSVVLVLAGLGTGVGAVALAARLHRVAPERVARGRDPGGGGNPDVQ